MQTHAYIAFALPSLLVTAKSLGLTILQPILATADEVIE